MIGVGCISGIYLDNITKVFKEIELIGVCDLVRERAENAQKNYGVPKIYETMHDAFADPEVDIVLNLTRPYEHFEVTKAALEAGKHVYSEKPLGASLEEGIQLRALAEEKGLMLGGAPDTFLGAGIQTCRRLIDDGFIGQPIGSAAYMIGSGHESWHPDPEFYYKYGGGPMFDMGPYYLTAMINLLGGVSEVMSASKITFPQRIITSQPLAGTVIDVFDDDLMGTTVTIVHGDGLESVYANLAATPAVEAGDQVQAGQVIGATGTTAAAESAQAPHLHLELRKDGESVDPLNYLPEQS